MVLSITSGWNSTNGFPICLKGFSPTTPPHHEYIPQHKCLLPAFVLPASLANGDTRTRRAATTALASSTVATSPPTPERTYHYRLRVVTSDISSDPSTPKHSSFSIGSSNTLGLPSNYAKVLSNAAEAGGEGSLSNAVRSGEFATIECVLCSDDGSDDDINDNNSSPNDNNNNSNSFLKDSDDAKGEVVAEIGFTPIPGVPSETIDKIVSSTFNTQVIENQSKTAVLRYITVPEKKYRGLGFSTNLLRLMEAVWDVIGGVNYGLLVVVGNDDVGGGLKMFWEKQNWKPASISKEEREFFGVGEEDTIMLLKVGDI